MAFRIVVREGDKLIKVITNGRRGGLYSTPADQVGDEFRPAEFITSEAAAEKAASLNRFGGLVYTVENTV